MKGEGKEQVGIIDKVGCASVARVTFKYGRMVWGKEQINCGSVGEERDQSLLCTGVARGR